MKPLLGFVAGVGVGALAMRAWSPPEVPAEPVAPAVPAVPVVPVVLAPETSPCDERLEALVRVNALLEGQLAQLGGARAEWPDDAPAHLRPEPVRSWLAQAAEGLPLETIELDCDEYPCVAFFGFEEGVPASSEVIDPLRAAFLEHTDGQGMPRVHVFGTDHGSFAALSLSHGEDGEIAQRLEIRIKQLAETHLAP